MWSLIKGIIWLVGLCVVTVFVLNFFGYEFNIKYFKEVRSNCEEKLRECQSEYVHNGIDNADCSLNCVNPRLIIKKK